ncbi:MAG: hypothetical protein M3525_05905, partial [Acidobacteriota bacterium]|nr:hypothetical protein [Acidobacteriota bacterium]
RGSWRNFVSCVVNSKSKTCCARINVKNVREIFQNAALTMNGKERRPRTISFCFISMVHRRLSLQGRLFYLSFSALRCNLL